MYWGHHLILDCSTCCAESIRSFETIKSFSKNLVSKIEMVSFGEPLIVHFGDGNKAGYTLVQLIETSNICCHFVEETNDMYLDVFSCKPFDPSDVERMVYQYFTPQKISTQFLHRQA